MHEKPQYLDDAANESDRQVTAAIQGEINHVGGLTSGQVADPIRELRIVRTPSNGLPPERTGITRRMHLEGAGGPLTCYATLNRRPTGELCELILCANKQGALEHGLLHCLALVVSLALRRGIEASEIATVLRGVEFEPKGLTGTPDIPMVRSVADYLARWMDAQGAA